MKRVPVPIFAFFFFNALTPNSLPVEHVTLCGIAEQLLQEAHPSPEAAAFCFRSCLALTSACPLLAVLGLAALGLSSSLI